MPENEEAVQYVTSEERHGVFEAKVFPKAASSLKEHRNRNQVTTVCTASMHPR